MYDLFYGIYIKEIRHNLTRESYFVIKKAIDKRHPDTLSGLKENVYTVVNFDEKTLSVYRMPKEYAKRETEQGK